MGWPWLDVRCQLTLLYHCRSLTAQGRGKYDRRLMGQGKNVDTQQLLSQAKQFLLGEISLFCCQSNQSVVMRNKTKSSKHLLASSSLLPRLNLAPKFSVSCAGNQGMGVAVSSLCILLLHLLSHTLSLLQCGVPPMVDSPPRTVTWFLPTWCSSSWTAPAWMHSIGCSPSRTDCSNEDHPWYDHCWWWAQTWSVTCPSQNWLSLTLSGIEEASNSFS